MISWLRGVFNLPKFKVGERVVLAVPLSTLSVDMQRLWRRADVVYHQEYLYIEYWYRADNTYLCHFRKEYLAGECFTEQQLKRFTIPNDHEEWYLGDKGK